MAPGNALSFKVTRRSPELIPPAKPTPHEFKLLSDIDDQDSFRFRLALIYFYRSSPAMAGQDPVAVIRKALAEALVFYYPFAGRLREGVAGKLMVECNGEGVVFIEADADVTLREFGDHLQPPFPCTEELIYDVPGTNGTINCPLILFQVTRLKCGGFIFGYRFTHTMTDGFGLYQFLVAVGEFARGAKTPSVLPVWQRELLTAREPSRLSCTHHEYDEVPSTKGTITPPHDIVHRSFFFGAREMSTLRHQLPPRLQNCSNFDLITACLWRCRTIALSPDPHEEVRMIFTLNARMRLNPPLPTGYYGNIFALPMAVTTAENLSRNPFHFAVDLVTKVKSATSEHTKSFSDFLAIKRQPPDIVGQSFVVSDVTRVNLAYVDFGWGNAAYAGTIKPVDGGPPDVNFYFPFKNHRGEKGVEVTISLPAKAMEVFVKELEELLNGGDDDVSFRKESGVFIKSAM